MTAFVKYVFGILNWYLMSDVEEKKMKRYIDEASTIQDAGLFRALDCSMTCEKFCYFCALDKGEITELCKSCVQLVQRDYKLNGELGRFTQQTRRRHFTCISDLSDQDLLIKYCLQSKVNKTAIDKLLKRGYDSLDALKLVNIEDLSSQNIPMGQRRLIYHIAQALINEDITSGPTGSKGGPASKKTGTAIITAEPLSQPHQDFSNVSVDTVNNDSYSQALLNSLLNHQCFYRFIK